MSININPGNNWQTITDGQPAGTTFIIKSGTHLRAVVNAPKAGNVYQFEPGVICDGEYAVPYLCRPSSTRNNVQFVGDPASKPLIKHYAVPSSDGVIDGDPSDSSGWLIQDLKFDSNGLVGGSLGTGGMGCKPGPNATVRRVDSDNNDQYGFGSGGDGILYEDCNSRFNGHANHDLNKGGCKLVHDNLTVRATAAGLSNWSNNNGPGVWFDTGTENFLIEGLTCRGNAKQGIFIEVAQRSHEPFGSFVGGVIRQVLTVGNGHIAKRSLMYDSGAVAGHSLNCEMDRVVSYGDYKGLGGFQQDRHEPDDSSPLMELKNLYVHDCTVYVLGSYGGSGTAGIAAGVAGTATISHDGYDPTSGAANNRFEDNDYFVLDSIGSPFRWDGSKTFAQWQAAGHDAGGSYTEFDSGSVPAEPEHPLGAVVDPPDPPDPPSGETGSGAGDGPGITPGSAGSGLDETPAHVIGGRGRELSVAVIDAITREHNDSADLMYFGFEDMEIFLALHPRPVTFRRPGTWVGLGGLESEPAEQIWQPVGGAIIPGPIVESAEFNEQGQDVQFAVIDPGFDFLGRILRARQFMRRYQYWRVYFETTGPDAGKIYAAWMPCGGYLNGGWDVEDANDENGLEPGTTHVRFRVTSPLGLIGNLQRSIQTNDRSHERWHEGDRFFDQVKYLQHRRTFFGEAGPDAPTAGKAV